jgi:hypothetical protein
MKTRTSPKKSKKAETQDHFLWEEKQINWIVAWQAENYEYYSRKGKSIASKYQTLFNAIPANDLFSLRATMTVGNVKSVCSSIVQDYANVQKRLNSTGEGLTAAEECDSRINNFYSLSHYLLV